MIKVVLSVFVLASAGLSPVGEASDDTAKVQYFSCMSCHGERGEGSDAIHAPALAGQSADYLSRQLKYFRDGLRGHADGDVYGQKMALMAANFARNEQGDAAIESLAQLISRMLVVSPPKNSVASLRFSKERASRLRSRGETLAQSCSACHGQSGEGNAALSAPRIAGLSLVYLRTQLHNFKEGRRGASAVDVQGQMMRNSLQALNSEADLQALAYYFSTLEP